MRKVCGDVGAELREFNGEDDHVHLLVEYPPTVAVSALVNNLKGVPARRLRSEFTGRVNGHIMHGHSWSPSCLAASCGGTRLNIIRQYIEQQRHPALPPPGSPRPEGRGSRPAITVIAHPQSHGADPDPAVNDLGQQAFARPGTEALPAAPQRHRNGRQRLSVRKRLGPYAQPCMVR